ncbi:hypothetical protein CVD28_06390 [Bacillus sp. M6-12]|uniref:arylamine N-acetyltransferase n=1 Tax=Bacillus sp. M6-12 TaxID=2054166 RepID=UPI000C75A101|nr:arylamine N-acetyltransferase [Bacillus sp. M6-12]PLS18741.1 hypothetical protein CVD28_06390 [Bacillus sp. M6-12]
MEIPSTFEKMRIIKGRTGELTPESLANTLLTLSEGGLCYELNPLFFLFLKENGLKVWMVRGAVYDRLSEGWSATGMTHVAVLVEHKGEVYLVDTGFGGNLPLVPVPLNGDVGVSENGMFRVERADTEFGDYVFYMKLKDTYCI